MRTRRTEGTLQTAGVLAMALVALGCTRGGDPRPLHAEPASLSAGAIPRGPAPPTAGLPIPSLDVQWTPPMVTAGDVEALAHALAGHDRTVVRLGPRLSDEARAEALVAALRPDLGVVGETTGGLQPIVGDVPLRRAEGPDGSRPTYSTEGLQLDPTAVRRLADALPDAALLLAVDDASVSPQDWQALPAHAVGSCAEPLLALAAGQEQALAQLEPFLDHADAVLQQMFRAELEAGLPAVLESLAPYRVARPRTSADTDATWRVRECGHAYYEYAQAFAACRDQATCEHAPRMFLQSGARVGFVEPPLGVARDCADAGPTNAVQEIRQLGQEATRIAADYLDPAWIALADRLGTVSEVHATLEDICAPRRRRFAEGDLARARKRLTEIGAALSSDDLDGPGATWVVESEALTVAGLGVVEQLARYDAGPGSPSREVVSKARALRQFVQSRARCRGTPRPMPLVALVVDVDAADIPFVGYFYEEELFCAELPPLREETHRAQP
jgi:hypothetical protein